MKSHSHHLLLIIPSSFIDVATKVEGKGLSIRDGISLSLAAVLRLNRIERKISEGVSSGEPRVGACQSRPCLGPEGSASDQVSSLASEWIRAALPLSEGEEGL